MNFTCKECGERYWTLSYKDKYCSEKCWKKRKEKKIKKKAEKLAQREMRRQRKREIDQMKTSFLDKWGVAYDSEESPPELREIEQEIAEIDQRLAALSRMKKEILAVE